MKRVCIIGHFGHGENLLNGQTVKTKIVTKEIVKELGKKEVSCIDTHGGVKALISAFRHALIALKYHKNIIIMPAANPTTLGGVKQAAAVADAAAAPTKEEFNALLTSLRNAGILATGE